MASMIRVSFQAQSQRMWWLVPTRPTEICGVLAGSGDQLKMCCLAALLLLGPFVVSLTQHFNYRTLSVYQD